MSEPGFSQESLSFLTDLAANNSREWFQAYKPDYERLIKKPADTFRADLEDVLGGMTGHQMSSKQFRINRDLRFSKDKTPYNTHIRMAFWPREAAFGGRDGQPPSFFLSIEADHIRLGTGCMAFPGPVLARYLDDLPSGFGDEVETLLADLERQGFEKSEPDLARAPKSVPAGTSHPLLARHKGLAVWKTLTGTGTVCGQAGPGNVAALWKPTLPLWERLLGLSEIS